MYFPFLPTTLARGLGDALRRFDADPEAYVAILCGSGRAFSSGADVQQRQLRSREEFQRLTTDFYLHAS